ncbi:GA module-containing protein, partial [uncultured Anaerococcus sp.]|uniref:GA module-containing protein n=2 Tax=uncultured Anaerococcus sp. TaxID=293428 RepID=UPI0025D7ACD6
RQKAIEDISKAQTLEEVNNALATANTQAEANEAAEDEADNLESAKSRAIAEIGNKANLTNEQRQKAIEDISKAQTLEEVNKVLEEARRVVPEEPKEGVSTDYLMEFLRPVVNFSKLTQAEKERFEMRMRAAQTEAEVYDIYNEAADLNNSRTEKPGEEKPEEKEDFTITVNVFKPFAKESYVTATFDGDRYGNDYDKAQADVWRWADAQSGVRNYRAEIVDKYTINIYELEDLDKDDSNDDGVIPFPIPVPDDDKDDDGTVIPPYKPNPTPDPDDDKETPVVDDDDKAPEEDNEYIDKLIKDLDDISKEMEEAIKLVDKDEADKDEDKDPSKDDDDNKKPAKDNEDDDKAANKDNCEKVVAVKDVVREDKDAVKVPARKSTVAHNNPKTGVVGLSAAAGALAVSVAGIVATRKKND